MSRSAIAKRTVEVGITDGINTFQCNPYTIVELFSEFGGGVHRGIGESRCGKNDKWDSLLGYEIAYGRAVKMIAKNSGLMKD